MQIDNIPHTCDVYRLSKHIQTSDERDCYSLHSLSLPDFPTKDKSYTFINELCIARLLLSRTLQKYGKFIDIHTHWGYCFLANALFTLFMGKHSRSLRMPLHQKWIKNCLGGFLADWHRFP